MVVGTQSIYPLWEASSFVAQGQGLDLVIKAQELLSPSRLCPLDECGHGGASLSNVRLLHNEHAHTRQEDKAVRGIEAPEPWLQGLALGLAQK